MNLPEEVVKKVTTEFMEMASETLIATTHNAFASDAALLAESLCRELYDILLRTSITDIPADPDVSGGYDEIAEIVEGIKVMAEAQAVDDYEERMKKIEQEYPL